VKAKAKAKGRRRVAQPGKGLVLKSYDFPMTLSPNTLINTTAGGAMALASATIGPMTTSSFNLVPSTNGLGNFYDVVGAVHFKLQDLLNYTTYTSMFDQYKIKKVTMTVDYLNNSSIVSGAGLMPKVYTYWDQDDSTVPVSLIQLTGKQGVKSTQLTASRLSHRFSVRPTIIMGAQVENGGTTSALVENKSRWLDCADIAIQHNAIKFCISDLYLPGGASVTQGIRFNFKYHMCFRAPLIAN
jgi:hypothetical protein